MHLAIILIPYPRDFTSVFYSQVRGGAGFETSDVLVDYLAVYFYSLCSLIWWWFGVCGDNVSLWLWGAQLNFLPSMAAYERASKVCGMQSGCLLWRWDSLQCRCKNQHIGAPFLLRAANIHACTHLIWLYSYFSAKFFVDNMISVLLIALQYFLL
jgi:hypothetical protein